MASLDVQGLGFCYPGAEAPTLTDISFRVESGGSMALLGSSGAGKTTLLNLLSGLLLGEEGQITIDGKEVSKVGAGDRGVAQVFQFPVLYESLNVRDNIAFPLKTRGVKRAERRRRAEEMAHLFELSDALTEKPATLSLFQKQLVGFAKALVRDDLALVLLDEPLTAVEPAMKWRLRGVVKKAQAQLGVTMIYVTHDQTEALTFADEVSVLHNGRLLQTAAPATLYEEPLHAEVARFIGSPGMSVLPGSVCDGQLYIAEVPSGVSVPDIDDGELELGFRPEWARLVLHDRNAVAEPAAAKPSDNPLRVSAVVRSQHLIGATATRALGTAEVSVGGALARVSCDITEVFEARSAEIQINRYQLFRDGWRIERGGRDGR